MKKTGDKEGTPTQRFFEQVRSLDVDTNWKKVEDVYKKKQDILDSFAEYIITQIDESIKLIGEDYGWEVKRDIFIGISPEQPNIEIDSAIQHLKINFLKELEYGGLVRSLKEVTKEISEDSSQCIQFYITISFYPSELKKYLKVNKGTTNFGKRSDEFYVRKDGEDFRHDNLLLDIGKNTDSYITFDVLYTLLPEGGTVKYEKMIKEIRKRIPKTKDINDKKMQKFIVDHLDEHNGFLHSTGVQNLVSGGRKLIRTVKGEGIEFNNKKSR